MPLNAYGFSCVGDLINAEGESWRQCVRYLVQVQLQFFSSLESVEILRVFILAIWVEKACRPLHVPFVPCIEVALDRLCGGCGVCRRRVRKARCGGGSVSPRHWGRSRGDPHPDRSAESQASQKKLGHAQRKTLGNENSGVLLFERVEKMAEADFAAELEHELLLTSAPKTDFMRSIPTELVARILQHTPSNFLRTTAKYINQKFRAAANLEQTHRTTSALANALTKGFEADLKKNIIEETPQAKRIGTLATEIELQLRQSPRFKALYRQLQFNLKDPKNPQLRSKLLCRELLPPAVLKMSSIEMASAALQQKRSEWREVSKRKCIAPSFAGVTTNLYHCERCNSFETFIHRTRRAGQKQVDRVRTWATCKVCHDRWEV